MNCPKCISPMVKVDFAGVEVDRCTVCHGMFFDELEKEKLKRMRGASAIDVGDAPASRRFNEVGPIKCPRCGESMVRMIDLDQPHIWFEHCMACGGAFLDAGELRDVAFQMMTGFFKDLVVKPKKKTGRKNMRGQKDQTKPNVVEQSFAFKAPAAQSVLLVGDFTHWQKQPISLKRHGEGNWRTTVPLQPGEHHYRFIVDGEWRDDPECTIHVPNRG